MLNYEELSDISHWQNDKTALNLITNDKMIILKATQGVGFIDDTLYKRFLSALSNKVSFLGIYHYLDKRYNGKEQALHFFSVYKKLVAIAHKCNIKLVPILDFEEGEVKDYHDFRTQWYDSTDTTLVTYCSYSWLPKVNNNNTLLWVAGWTNNEDIIRKRIDELSTMILYQYDNKYCDGSKDIYNVDRDFLIRDRYEKLFKIEGGLIE